MGSRGAVGPAQCQQQIIPTHGACPESAIVCRVHLQGLDFDSKHGQGSSHHSRTTTKKGRRLSQTAQKLRRGKMPTGSTLARTSGFAHKGFNAESEAFTVRPIEELMMTSGMP